VQLDPIDPDGRGGHVGQDELIGQMHLPVGHLDRSRCRQERGGQLGDLRGAVDAALERTCRRGRRILAASARTRTAARLGTRGTPQRDHDNRPSHQRWKEAMLPHDGSG
jgi:hypothetical protein